MSDIDQNNKNAIEFYDLMFNQCRPKEAVDKYVGDVYIQHNPPVGDGKEAFVEYFRRMAEDYPGKKVELKKAIAENNYVVFTLLSALA